MIVTAFGDVEGAVKRWLATTTVAPLVQRTPGVYNIFSAMPKASPVPSVIMALIGGGPTLNDLPQGASRLQFDCWGTTRDQSVTLALALVGELQSLPQNGGYVDATSGVYIGSAVVANMRWLPDPNSDLPRYIVDALITTVT